jgi:putative transposase
MACESVKQRGVSITLACSAFGISQSCYRHVGSASSENQKIADWLLRLTDNHRTWGFGLCFLYLRNVKRFGWNHKRVYRVYRQLELNLRIKPRARLTREKPQPLAVPAKANITWEAWISCMTAWMMGAASGCSTSLTITTERRWAWRLISAYPVSA